MNAIARPRVRLEGVVIFHDYSRSPDAKNWWDKYKNHFMK